MALTKFATQSELDQNLPPRPHCVQELPSSRTTTLTRKESKRLLPKREDLLRRNFPKGPPPPVPSVNLTESTTRCDASTDQARILNVSRSPTRLVPMLQTHRTQARSALRGTVTYGALRTTRSPPNQATNKVGLHRDNQREMSLSRSLSCTVGGRPQRSIYADHVSRDTCRRRKITLHR